VGLLETTGRWPGDTWAMVLAGHVTLEGDQRGPFYGLGSLRPGQALLLYTHDGRLWRYRVVGQRLLTADAVKAIYRRDGRRLLLMTCAVWDDAQHDYTHRLVIEAVLEASVGARGSAQGLLWR
jgi:sortase (surface protein transpeptidase)